MSMYVNNTGRKAKFFFYINVHTAGCFYTLPKKLFLCYWLSTKVLGNLKLLVTIYLKNLSQQTISQITILQIQDMS